MFPGFRAHAAPRTPLMFTSRPAYGEGIGRLEGDPLYHVSLDATEYRQLLDVATSMLSDEVEQLLGPTVQMHPDVESRRHRHLETRRRRRLPVGHLENHDLRSGLQPLCRTRREIEPVQRHLDHPFCMFPTFQAEATPPTTFRR
jgi:hypothetical protein